MMKVLSRWMDEMPMTPQHADLEDAGNDVGQPFRRVRVVSRSSLETKVRKPTMDDQISRWRHLQVDKDQHNSMKSVSVWLPLVHQMDNSDHELVNIDALGDDQAQYRGTGASGSRK